MSGPLEAELAALLAAVRASDGQLGQAAQREAHKTLFDFCSTVEAWPALLRLVPIVTATGGHTEGEKFFVVNTFGLPYELSGISGDTVRSTIVGAEVGVLSGDAGSNADRTVGCERPDCPACRRVDGSNGIIGG